jgi:hypothetical protein
MTRVILIPLSAKYTEWANPTDEASDAGDGAIN